MFPMAKSTSWIWVLVLGSPIPLGSPTCQDLTISISASAENVALPNLLDWSTVLTYGIGLLLDLPPNLISGTYSISTTFCELENAIPHRHHSLQVLTHGLVSSVPIMYELEQEGNLPENPYPDFYKRILDRTWSTGRWDLQ